MSRLIALCIGFFILTLPVAAEEPPRYAITDQQGQEGTFTSLLSGDRLVLVNFWLAGCEPSNELLPYLQAFQDTYGPDGLRSVVIYRSYGDTGDLADCYFTANDITLPIVEDQTGLLQEQYDVCAFPHTVLIDYEGNLLLDVCGYSQGFEVCIQQIIHQELRDHVLQADQVIRLDDQGNGDTAILDQT